MRIDPDSGVPALAGDPDAIFETFRTEYAPARGMDATARAMQAAESEGEVREQLF